MNDHTQEPAGPQHYTLNELFAAYRQSPQPTATNQEAPMSTFRISMAEPEFDDEPEFEDRGDDEPEIEPWPEPGSLTPAPDATPELALATIEINLLQAEHFVGQAAAALKNRQGFPALAALGCLAVNFDGIDEMLDNLANNAGSPQDAAPIQQMLARFGAVQENFEEQHLQFVENMPELCGPGYADQAYTQARIAPLQKQHRIRHAAELMQGCQRKAQAANASPAAKYAQQRLACDLYHSAADHRDRLLEELAEVPIDPETAAAYAGCVRIYESTLQEFNADLPPAPSPRLLAINPKIQGLIPSLHADPAAAQLHTLEIRGAGNPTRTTPCLVFHHAGKKFVQVLGEPYPAGYPAGAALRDALSVNDILQAITATTGFAQAESAAVAMLYALAQIEMHDVQAADLKGIVESARAAKLTNGSIRAMFERIADYDPEITGHLLKMAGFDQPPVSRRQARAVIAAARQARIDENCILDLVEAMHRDDPGKLGVRPQRINAKTRRNLSHAARQAGIPEPLIDAMLQADLV